MDQTTSIIERTGTAVEYGWDRFGQAFVDWTITRAGVTEHRRCPARLGTVPQITVDGHRYTGSSVRRSCGHARRVS